MWGSLRSPNYTLCSNVNLRLEINLECWRLAAIDFSTENIEMLYTSIFILFFIIVSSTLYQQIVKLFPVESNNLFIEGHLMAGRE